MTFQEFEQAVKDIAGGCPSSVSYQKTSWYEEPEFSAYIADVGFTAKQRTPELALAELAFMISGEKAKELEI